MRAANYVAAWEAVTDSSTAENLIRGNVPLSTSYSSLSPQLQSLIAKVQGRKRRITTVLQAASSGGDPKLRAAKVPALLWEGWTRALAPRRLHRGIAAGALAAAVVFTGSRLTHSAALTLLDRDAPARRVTHVMRELGRNGTEPATLATIVRLATYLDTYQTPIDYGRRRGLDYTDLLSRHDWDLLADQANVHSGHPRRWALARGYLYRQLSGNSTRKLPPHRGAPTPTDAEVDQFTREIPARVRDALLSAGRSFLLSRDITEPAAWSPNVADFMPLPPPVEGVESVWATRRPAQARGTETMDPQELVAAYQAGASLPELGSRARVSRQTVGRILADEGVFPRRGPKVRVNLDRNWLETQYEIRRLTIPEIAALTDCSISTISRRLKAYDIPLRPPGSGSEPMALRPLIDAGDSVLLKRVLIGRHAYSRARRFLTACEHPSLSSAAAALGVTPAALSTQMGLLSRLAGGRLICAAASGRPQRLTQLGELLQAELTTVFEIGDDCVNGREDPADQEG
jgi:hypothetical protein